MKAILNPWVLLAMALTIGGAFWFGMDVGADREIARQAKLDEILRRVEESAAKGSANEIAKIEVRHQTIENKAEVIVREKLVYRECVNDPDVVGLLDAARANSEPPDTAGNSLLP